MQSPMLSSAVALLMLVFALATTLWALETFILAPRRLAALCRRLQHAPCSLQDVREAQSAPLWLGLVRQASTYSLTAAILIVFFWHLDVDFATFLVFATVLSGVFWGLDLLFLRKRRARLLAALPADLILPADLRQELLAEPSLVEYGHSFFPVLAIVFVVRSFLAEPFTIPSGSMLPTLQIGDYIIVNKYAYGLRNPITGTLWWPLGRPQRGDIMVFRYPENPHVDFIKRVVGLPGDHIVFDEGQLYINGRLQAQRLLLQIPQIDPWQQYFDENLSGVHHIIRQEVGRYIAGHHWQVDVPAGSYFMMGDNRDNSRDSRFWGFLPDRLIVGKAVFIWMHKEPGLHLPSLSRDAMLNRQQILEKRDVVVSP